MIIPYIVYGNVTQLGSPQVGATVTATNNTKGGTTSETTDASGHYEIDLSNLSNGYAVGDSITITASTGGTESFNVDSGFEYNQDIEGTQTHAISLTVTHTPLTSSGEVVTISATITHAADIDYIQIVGIVATITYTFAKSLTIQISKTATVAYTPNPLSILQFIDLDNYKLVDWSVSKTINDALWKFSGSVELHDLPGTYKNLRAIMPDHNDVDRCVFMGFIPGADYAFGAANKKAQMNAYDFGWYLASQVVPLRITSKDTNPATTLKTMLGDSDWASKTGINCADGNINDVASWASIQKQFGWKFATKKQIAINEMCNYAGSIFHIKYKEVGGMWYTVAYFVADDGIDHADTGFDLPTKVTFSNPDPYVVSISKSLDEGDKVNRVMVYAINREDGRWKTATEESTDVTSGAEIPIEMMVPGYIVEPPPADDTALQVAADAKALELYTLFYTNATTTIIKATLKRRSDLELWQKVAFSGYPDILSDDMRIVGITYKHAAADDMVEIQCIPLKDLSNATARRMALKLDYVSGLRDIINGVFNEMTENEIGEVTAVTGAKATVELESDGSSVEVRILNP